MKLILEKLALPHVRGAFVGKQVFLRPATTADFEALLLWQEGADPQRLRQTVEPIIPLSRRLAELEEYGRGRVDSSAADLMVIKRSDEGLSGMLSYRSLNLLNRSARLEVHGSPEIHETADLREALGLLVSYLFYQFNLNSVYAEVSELNTLALDVFKALEFTQDGLLRQRHFFDGMFHDIRIYSLLRFEASR